MQVEGPATIYVYNKSVVKSVKIPEYRLKKKHLYIWYHAVSESVDGNKVQIIWVPTGRNLSNLLTKILEGPKIRDIVSNIIH